MAENPNENPELSKEDAMRRFLLSKMNICPFGREAALADSILYRELDFTDLRPLSQMAEQFETEKKSALVAIAPNDPMPDDHETGYILSAFIFTELGRVLVPERTEDWETIQKHVLSGKFAEIDPSMGGSAGNRKFAFPMGPQFGEGHPHYAPHLSIIITRSADIQDAYIAEPKKVLSIDDRLRQMLGDLGLLEVQAEDGKVFFDDGFYGITGTQMKIDREIRTPAGLLYFIEKIREHSGEILDSDE